MSVIVTATFTPTEGSHDQLVAALSTAIAEVHGEVGCELFALHNAADGTLVLIEKWTTVQDLDAHGNGAAVARLNSGIAPFIAQPPVVIRMSPIASGAPSRGLL